MLSAGTLVVLLAGCGTTSTPAQPAGGTDPGTPSAASSAGSTAAATPAAGPHNQADVTFTTMMIPHHRQAVMMSDLVIAKPGLDQKITDLATRIKTAQAPEISQMTGWLVGWGTDPSASPAMAGMGGMDGMMSQAEMDGLQKTPSAEAAKLYLTGMIKHHQGAVAMARTELASGQNADAKRLATTIVTTQQAEISEMQKLLAR